MGRSNVSRRRWPPTAGPPGLLVLAALGLGIGLSASSSARSQDCVQPSADGCPLEIGQRTSSVLADGGEIHAWLLRLPASADLVIVLTDLSVDYDLHVYDSGGRLVGESINEGTQDELVSLRAAVPGTYHVYVNSGRGAISPVPYGLLAIATGAETQAPVSLSSPIEAGGEPIAAQPAEAISPPVAVKGQLVYEAKLDGTPGDLRGEPFGTPGDDPTAVDVRLPVGAVELAVLRPGGSKGVTLNTGGRLRYACELDMSVEPGSDLTFFWNVRWAETGRRGYRIEINALNEFMEFIYRNADEQPATRERLGPHVPVPGLQTGTVHTIGIVADESRYTLFIDGMQALDVTDARLDRPISPEGGAFGRGGTVRIVGARVYTLL